MKNIQFDHVGKSYGPTEVVKGLHFDIKEGERLILLGPSGCGKSTTLRMIAGLEDITAGNLYMDGKRVNDIPSGLRNVAMVFQNYALYPHMTVRQNILYALKVQKMSKAEMDRRLNNALEMLHLKEYENRLPKDLSGGQRQRVALARAVVKNADYFLLDEPLSNLDAQLRLSARKELIKIHEMYRQTMVYVTHDQVEAMTFGDRVALLHEGRLQMIDTPENVYHRPANLFTAKFIGSPPMNLINVNIQDSNAYIGGQAISLDLMWLKQLSKSKGDKVILGIRPEHLAITNTPGDHSLGGVVKYVENYGPSYGVSIDMEGNEIVVMSEEKQWSPDEKVYVKFPMKHLHIFDEETTNSIGYPEQLDREEDTTLKMNTIGVG
ncbi:ABC transporter ATP-binding protein [Metabacillus malikii]|uniref:Sn-glycerol 3-phosphate transport system ATP-binding protein n=1 Tax=Metabacillus malikii TaxID=1504265 RepID=A0ABT9ZLT9_9BACI|nr:ABC transporter ATP-binding protein [Metabacillus malikii]MDQ0232160.1 sn-glycerol 3-phosphate transport system ATP-binding protein [Metabacillus malikii]